MKTAVERFKELMLLKAEVLECEAFKDPDMLSVLNGHEEVLEDHIKYKNPLYLNDCDICPHCIINVGRCSMCEWGMKYGDCNSGEDLYYTLTKRHGTIMSVVGQKNVEKILWGE